MNNEHRLIFQAVFFLGSFYIFIKIKTALDISSKAVFVNNESTQPPKAENNLHPKQVGYALLTLCYQRPRIRGRSAFPFRKRQIP